MAEHILSLSYIAEQDIVQKKRIKMEELKTRNLTEPKEESAANTTIENEQKATGLCVAYKNKRCICRDDKKCEGIDDGCSFYCNEEQMKEKINKCKERLMKLPERKRKYIAEKYYRRRDIR